MDWKIELANEINNEIKNKKIPLKKINLTTKKVQTINIISIAIIGILSIITIILLILNQRDIVPTVTLKTVSYLFYAIIAIAIFLIIINIILYFILNLQNKAKKNIANRINNKINLASFYDKAIKIEISPKLNVININKEFSIWPYYLDKLSFTRMIVNNVINFSHSNFVLSIGTITERIENTSTDSKGNTKTTYKYYRRFILTAKYNKSFEVSAYIHPSNFLNKFHKGKNNVSLESPEFNKLFSVTSDNQLTIRKILTPKVMVKLMDLINRNKHDCPYIAIEETEIAMVLSSFKVFAYDDPNRLIGVVTLSNKISETAEKYIEIIERDITQINVFFNCLKALDISF